MKKRVISFVLAFTLVILLAIPSFAETESFVCLLKLEFSGTNANCSVKILGSGTINATLELWHGSTLIASWSDTGTNRLTISGTAAVLHGQTYTLTVTGTVSGVMINATPVTKTCP